MNCLKLSIMVMRSKFFSFLILAFFFFAAVSCQSEQEVTANSVDLADIPDQEGWNSTRITTSKGKISTQIKYVHMKRYSKRKLVEFIDGVEFELFDEEGQQVSQIHATAAKLNELNNDVKLSGSIVVESNDGLKLFTESLHWNQNRGKFTADDFVTIVTAENDTIFGKGFESEKSLKNWTIKEPSGITQKKLLLDIDEDEKRN